MPVSRQQHDPFNDHHLRPTLHPQGSQHSLRSNASTTSSRSRQQRDQLLAPSLSRRPTSRNTPNLEDEVFADSESEPESAAVRRQRRLKSVRAGRPGSLEERGKQRQARTARKEAEGAAGANGSAGEFVKRQPDGGFVKVIPGFEAAVKAQLEAHEIVEGEKLKVMDDHYAAVAREYFTSGAAVPSSRTSRRQEDEFDEYKIPMMSRLREQVLEKLELERWLYEPVDRFQAGIS
ncbi:hypothetical protein K431DRAFT_313203 [Polychaeton citri CBS 116435]|uniref:Uncharacterized protein n=1 Tax=Polychaeton citri CBS 116435 TaxID=1314669 RepID=A0A9P4Q6P6_9PEZI|nr:hypothetical protein K431DRAFT_313203 [Polychaeton citri CBS 116435]